MEDTGRGRGWRLMEQRFPSASSWQSDLLITHCSGVFISLIMQIGRGDTLTHTQRQAGGGQYLILRGGLSFLCVVELCDLAGLCE